MAAGTRPLGTAAGRWAGVGPYYAMFPTAFADEVVRTYTEPGEAVLDPFAGRGTATFSAASAGRKGIGIEANPVGWVYSKAKLHPAAKPDVLARLAGLLRIAPGHEHAAGAMPEFFQLCFCPGALKFLLAARSELDWKRKPIDWTTMALLLVYLHGKRGQALSNQMRQTKSMSPDYAVRWWRRHNLTPLSLDLYEFMRKRVEWRYRHGRPSCTPSVTLLGDSRRVLPRLIRSAEAGRLAKARLLLTSPPYYAITNYHYDQWLRSWLLGGDATAKRTGGAVRGKFENKRLYKGLLHHVFLGASAMLVDAPVIYVRTDSRPFTLETTISVLQQAFPEHSLARRPSPFHKPTQTSLFGDKCARGGDVDLVLTPRRPNRRQHRGAVTDAAQASSGSRAEVAISHSATPRGSRTSPLARMV